MRNPILFASAVFVLTAPLGACATAAPTYRAPVAGGYAAPVEFRQADDGLLAEPPADAKAGQCFAKVVVPGQPVYGPPTMQSHMRWVQTPPQPGTIGPVWCQVWEQGYQPSVSYTPERFGWIRVICDHDATADKIGHIQHRLHDWGYYSGGYAGKYDDSTAQAVKRFQADRHIEHGGYLSYKTMDMLETAPPAPVMARPMLAQQPMPMMAPPPMPAPPPMMAPPMVAQQPMIAPPVYAQGFQGGYAQQGYDQQAYAQQSFVQQSFAPQQPQVINAPPQVLPPIYQQGAPMPSPVYAQPQFAAPIFAQPQFAQAQFGQTQFGQTQVGQVQFGQVPCPGACPTQGAQPCGAAPCQGNPYGQRNAAYQGRWLSWSGKSGY